jgi:polysaccharide pyruvyl transferase WcaK-like protein
MEPGKTSKMSFALFGHFDSSNFGNECTLQAMIYNIRRRHPNAKLICISTGPAKTAATHHIEAIAVSELTEVLGSAQPIIESVTKAFYEPNRRAVSLDYWFVDTKTVRYAHYSWDWTNY